MRIIRNTAPPSDGLVQHEPTTSMEIPFQTLIRCQYGLTHFPLFDVPPWGTVLPYQEGMEAGVTYHFEAETIYMPGATVVGVRWTPRSGNNVHVLSFTVPADEPATWGAPIPYAWVVESQGEDVLIEFEASYPDGSVETGTSLDVHVSKSLGFGAVNIADLNNGDLFNPDHYPDGVTVKVDPIVDIVEYSILRCYWRVKAFIAGNVYLFHEWGTSFTGAPGKAYEFVVPPEAYSGLNVPQFDRFEIEVRMNLSLAPEPVPQFRWSFGAHDFLVSFDVK